VPKSIEHGIPKTRVNALGLGNLLVSECGRSYIARSVDFALVTIFQKNAVARVRDPPKSYCETYSNAFSFDCHGAGGARASRVPFACAIVL